MIGVCRFELSRWILLHFYPAEHWMTCILCLYGNSCSLEYPSVSRSPWRHLLGSLPPSYRSCQGSPLIPRLCVFPWRCSCCGVSGFGMRREVRHERVRRGRLRTRFPRRLAADGEWSKQSPHRQSAVCNAAVCRRYTPSVTKYWLGGLTNHLWSPRYTTVHIKHSPNYF